MNHTNADTAVIGLAVMGENLILNMANHGFTVTTYNRTTTKVGEFLAGRAKGKSIIGAHTYERFGRTRREYFHTTRAGRGGNTASATYAI